MPPTFTPEVAPTPSESDLRDAARLMDRWGASLGNSDAVWACLEAIAQRGGFGGAEATVREVMNGADAGLVVQRPWHWWSDVAEHAQEVGDDTLPVRIFLFMHIFTNQMAPHLGPAESMDMGLEKPPIEIYQRITGVALRSAGQLPPELVISDSPTGPFDAGTARKLAEMVASGATP